MSDKSESLTFILPDQRTLEYATYGVPAGAEQVTVIYFHGTPGCHHEAELVHDRASHEGLRIVAINRPGFGRSSPHPHRTLLSFSQDVLALVDHLGIQRFAMMAFSGGCPYALTCLHALPRSRILHTTVVSGAYPFALGTDGMKLSNRIMLSIVQWVPKFMVAGVDYLLIGRLARDAAHPERFEKALRFMFKTMPPEDQAALAAEDGKVFNIAVEGARGGLQQGAQPAVEEMRLVSGPLGFDLADLKIEKGQLIMWHGAKDPNAPLEMAEKAASRIPGADLRVEKDLAHISLCVFKRGEILAALLDATRTLQ
ncbi:alpha/beta-hydrolase [Hypoxylon sp. NC0597]|nr:alpha/beta-hydrolase [Hypoxylon sp. NC0597]